MEFATRYNWWALAIRGFAAITFGILAFVWPALTLTVLVLLFGFYAIVDGVFAIAVAIHHSRVGGQWWMLWLEGILGIIAGLVTLILPGVTALVLLFVIAFWSIVTGILEIAAAIRLRQEIEGEWLMAISGVASLLLGFVLLLFPRAGALALVWWIGAYALVFGALLVTLAFRLRGRGAVAAI